MMSTDQAPAVARPKIERPVTDRPVIALLGLGEAGSHFATDLMSTGATVRAFDPLVPAQDPTVACASDADAARGAQLILSLTSAHDALEALQQALPGIGTGAIYADLNTGSARLKQTLAESAEQAGVAFADVALMAPVPGLGLRTPMLACGPAADEYGRVMRALGGDVTILPGPPGTAATRKLLRSVFYKGLAAAVTESLRAGHAAGCADWLRDDIAQVLADASAATVGRLEQGSIQHARRRAEEMKAAGDMLDDLGVPARIARASQAWLEQLMTEQQIEGPQPASG
jgi:3-hydroxyisobutyrate dehydrogenase-like beta-hydroxyacid dehydrogenase